MVSEFRNSEPDWWRWNYIYRIRKQVFEVEGAKKEAKGGCIGFGTWDIVGVPQVWKAWVLKLCLWLADETLAKLSLCTKAYLYVV